MKVPFQRVERVESFESKHGVELAGLRADISWSETGQFGYMHMAGELRLTGDSGDDSDCKYVVRAVLYDSQQRVLNADSAFVEPDRLTRFEPFKLSFATPWWTGWDAWVLRLWPVKRKPITFSLTLRQPGL